MAGPDKEKLCMMRSAKLVGCAFVVVLATGWSDLAAAQAAPEVMTAVDAYEKQDYARCAQVLGTLDTRSVVLPKGGRLLLIECIAADGQLDRAARQLDVLLPKGGIDLEDLRHKNRPGLNALRKQPSWSAIIQKAERLDAQRKARFNAPLREELLAREARDQQLRHEAIARGGKPEDWALTESDDHDNIRWFKAMLDQHGWPTVTTVGEEGARAAWLLVQHADRDPELQARALSLMQEAVSRDEAFASELAMLTDRVLLAQGKPQRYGSQFESLADGSMVLRPTEDVQGLDARRAAVGLPSMEEYRKALSEAYRKEVR
jgi:hypothetical protein